MLKRATKPLRRIVLIEEGLAKRSKKQHWENTDKWHLCKAGSFSCGQSLRTPPLEGISLHRWNNSVERPWGILSLFTTCLWLCEITLPQAVTCLPPVYDFLWNHLAKGCDMFTACLRFSVKSPCHRLCHVYRLFTIFCEITLPQAVTCLPPVYDFLWNHPATGCDIWTTPKSTLRGEKH